MNLTKEQSRLFRRTMADAETQLDRMDAAMENVINTARLKLKELKASKITLREIYESSAAILGVEMEASEKFQEDNPSQLMPDNLES
jgi:hypothetical protein